MLKKRMKKVFTASASLLAASSFIVGGASFADCGSTADRTESGSAVSQSSDEESGEHDQKDSKSKIFMEGSYNLFKPEEPLTRAQAAAVFLRTLKQNVGADSPVNKSIEERFSSMGTQNEKPSTVLSDVAEGWYKRHVHLMLEKGIMDGYPDGTFKPDNPITRAELCKMISKFLDPASKSAEFSDIEGHWGREFIDVAYERGIINGYPDGTFKPDESVKRIEAAKMINIFFDRGVDANGLKTLINPEKIKVFNDIDKDHWGYYEMVEATNDHIFKESGNGRIENWMQFQNHLSSSPRHYDTHCRAY